MRAACRGSTGWRAEHSSAGNGIPARISGSQAQPGPAVVIAFSAHTAAAFAAALVFSSPISGNPAAAQPACAAETLGVTACLGSKLCACTYDRGGIASGIPAGYRWDCGILRPGCGGSVPPPATLNPYEGPYPHALGIDRSRRSPTVRRTEDETKARPETTIRSNRRGDRRTPDAWLGAPLPLLPPD